MERIRIGNNIAISWAVYDLNGRIHNLEGKELRLYMAVGGYKVYVNSYTIQGNVISWVFFGSEQTKTGDYKLVLEETDPLSGASAFDVRAAFRLTPEDVVGPDIVLGPANVSVQSVLTYSNLVGVESIDVVESSEDSGDNSVTLHLIDGSFAEVVIKNGSKGPKGDKGDTGATGPKGEKGDTGERGPVGVDTVNAAIGTNDPSQAPSVDKDLTDGVLSLTFNNIKGQKGDKGNQGNTGSSVDYPYELVNNVTTDDATKGLSAAQGVVLDGKIGQLGQELNDKIGDEEKTITYLPNSGLIYGSDSVVSANDTFNGVLVRLIKDVEYNILTTVTVSRKLFNNKPSIGDVSVADFVDGYIPSVEGQYLLITVRPANTPSVNIKTSQYGMVKDINDLKNDIIEINADISELDADVNGTTISVEEICALTANKFYNTTSHFRDGATTFSPSTIGDLEGCNCLKIPVHTGETFKIKSNDGDRAYAVGLYILTSSDATIISSLLETTSEVILNIEQDGFLYVNLKSYNSSTDYVKKITYTTVGGYKNYVDEKIAENNQLYGKKIVCFGDSLTEFKDSAGKSYSDYIAELYGAELINCGIGGTRFMQRTIPVLNPSTSEEGYAGLDIISMVRAACGVEFDGSHSYADVVENAAIYIRDHESDDNTSIVQRMLDIDWSTVDAVIVFAGTNDWNNGVGHWGTTGSSDVNTTMGAINEIIRLLLSTYKHIKLYWVTPIVRWINYSGGIGNPDNFSDNFVKSLSGESGTLKQFSQMIENEVVLNHIPICDAYNTLGWNMYNFSQYFPDSDGTHPTKGFKQIAEKIVSFMISNKTF